MSAKLPMCKKLIEHLPLVDKKPSGSTDCSMLAQIENFYFMDNHRLALWCWQHYLNTSNSQAEQFNFLHIDAHEDAKVDIDSTWWNKIQKIDLAAYIKEKSSEGEYALFRWDNYLPVYIHQNQTQIRKSVFVTHDVGVRGFAHQRISAYKLLQEFPKLFIDELQWIINLDVDYFFAKEYKSTLLFDEDWIREFFIQLKNHYDKGDIALMTIALSPECCGSWSNAEKVIKIFDEIFNLGISDYLAKTAL